MQQLFESINFDLFEDSLDMPIFFVYGEKKMQVMQKEFEIPYNFDGITIPTEKTFLVGVEKNLCPQMFFDTLVHELIHVYLFPYMGHGRKFKNICEKAVDLYY
jgi:hypothetical protein